MVPGKNETRLLERLTDIPVIDAHEHLVTEKARISRKIDFFILFSHYTQADFLSAGMPAHVYKRLRDDADMPVEKKWAAFSPFYPSIRYGSYARPARIWIQEELGYGDLTEKNCREISDKLQHANRKGLYRRVLRDKCGIVTALVATSSYRDYDFDLLTPIFWCLDYEQDGIYRRFLQEAPGKGVRPLDAYLDWMQAGFEDYMRMGGVGIKARSFPFEKTAFKKADRIFRKWQTGGEGAAVSDAEKASLASAIYERVFSWAEKRHVPVAMHSGVWGDFRESQPAHLIPMASSYPGVWFDLFHLGMPYAREAVMIGKMFPNVSLNLCWSAVVSPEQTIRMLDECVDMVSMNKIIAFGGDYGCTVEKVYGHLKMAKEVVARVLAKRIDRGQIDISEAVRIARMWFHDNPVRIYNLRSDNRAGR